MRAPVRKRFQLLISCMFIVCVLGSNSNAGPVCDTIGKGLDKMGSAISKLAEKGCALKPDGKHLKGLKKKLKKKKMKAGGCLKGAFKKSCGCKH